MNSLTDKQREVLDYITEYIEVRCKSPSVLEIKQNFGFKSPNSVEKHLKALERKQRIRRIPGECRNIELLRGVCKHTP